MPADETGVESLVRELGRINSELATQRRLSAMMVHDLSNPTQIIVGLSELLLEDPSLPSGVRPRLEQLHRSAVTLAALVADLNYGIGLDDPVNLHVERLNLAEVVTSVVGRHRVLAAAKDMDLALLFEEGDAPECWIAGDAIKLERLLANLLGNAVKFSPAGSTASVALHCGAGTVSVAIHDQGPGISEEARALVFDAFHREQSAAHLPGLGLGLSIAKQIVESHGGAIRVESEVGLGATFVVQLPLADDGASADCDPGRAS